MADSADARSSDRTGTFVKLGVLVAVLAGAFFGARALGLFEYTDPAALAATVRRLRDRPFIMPLFVASYALATALALPGSVLTIAGGAIFGFGLGSVLNWTGALIGATLAFLLARALGLDAVRRLLGKKADRLEVLAGAHGFTTVLRLRLIPAVPFNVLNFGAGLAGVSLRDYVLGTALGLIPGTLVYTYFADALLGGAAGARRDALIRLAVAGTLLLALSFLPALVTRVRNKGKITALLAMLLTPAVLHAQTRDGLHAPFDALLRQHVVAGMVDYEAFERAPEFRAYLAALNATDPARLGEPARLAYWINVYNAYTIQLINDRKERKSIRNINKSLGFLKLKGPWGDPIVRAGGRTLTLDDVEHRIIRKEFREPRIHFALVCAAVGCPPLRSEAFTAERLEAQLQDQGRLFLLASPAKNRVDVPARTLFASMIFKFYPEDFGGSDASIARYIAGWYPEGPERALLLASDVRLKYTDYDWSLNSQARARR